MNDETIEFEVGSGNVYADLGFPDAEDMRVKAQLPLFGEPNLFPA